MLRRARPVLLPVAVAAAVFSGCGSSDGDSIPAIPLTPATPAPEPTPPPAEILTPTLASIQALIFDPRCVGHHGDHATEAGLDLRDGMARANLVNIPSVQAALDLVEPGDPESSYLVHKIEAREGIVGDRMPPGGAALTEDEIAAIRDWISAGAPGE